MFRELIKNGVFEMDNLIFNVTDEFIGERIDKYLSMQIQGKSRSFIQGLITDKKIDINGSEIKVTINYVRMI